MPPLSTQNLPPEAFPAVDVRRAISSFPRGSAAGPSPGHLAELISVPRVALLDGIVIASVLFASGSVPVAARPFFFGARLSALRKKDGGVRPIACGDVLRRLAARLLCRLVRPVASSLLLASHQVGVGVRHGAEAPQHTAPGSQKEGRMPRRW